MSDVAVRLRGHADATFPLARLGAFRDQLHACFERRADALFDLGDALLCAQAVPSLPHLSLEPVHRRGWASIYAALARGRIQVEQLRDLLAGYLPPADPAWPTTPVASVVTSKLDDELVACTRKVPSLSRDATFRQPHSPCSEGSLRNQQHP
jgi:hypothetical protein